MRKLYKIELKDDVVSDNDIVFVLHIKCYGFGVHAAFYTGMPVEVVAGNLRAMADKLEKLAEEKANSAPPKETNGLDPGLAAGIAVASKAIADHTDAGIFASYAGQPR